MYTSDLSTILQLLEDFHRNGMLRTELPGGLPGINQPCFVEIKLRKGEIHTCLVKNARGKTLLNGQKAFEALLRLDRCDWTFENAPEEEALSKKNTDSSPRSWTQAPPDSPETSYPASPIPSYKQTPRPHASRVPRRLYHLSDAAINAWPRKHRLIYVLVDGTRDVEQIANVLALPPEDVEKALLEIQATGAILL